MKKSSTVFKYWPFLFGGILFFHLVLLISTRLTAWPEMLFWPYLVNLGWLPYRDIAIAHTPLLVVALSLFYKLTPAGIVGQQLFTWLIIIFSDLLFFVVVKKLFDIKTAVLGLFFYIILQTYYEGNGIWFDHALVPLIILLFYFLQKRRLLLAGICWGLALLTKQTAVWFILPVLLSKPKLTFFKGLLIILSLFVFGLFIFGLHEDFYRWAITFGVGTLPRLTGQINPPNARELVASLAPFLIVIPFSPLSLLPWLVAGAMGAMPRFEFFHFQPALPFLAILYTKAINRKIFFLLILIIAILVLRGIYRQALRPTRFYTENDLKIIEQVKEKTQPGEKTFVTGYWDNLYPLTGTLPAIRPFIPQLSWYLNQPGITQGIITDIQNNKPKIIVRGPPVSLVLDRFINVYYRKVASVGQVDIMELKP